MKGKRLCRQIGTYCKKKFLGVCLVKMTTYCCFGTKLSRLIQEQGRGQLGISWGTAENPQCQGLTVEQLSRIDFSTVDLSEIFEDMMANFKQPDVSKIQEQTAHQLKHDVQQIQTGVKHQPLAQGEDNGL
jgi:conjugal transfer mating pair stabilization protein TraN